MRLFRAVFAFIVLAIAAYVFFTVGFREQNNANDLVLQLPSGSKPPETHREKGKPLKLTFVGDIMLDRYIRQVGEHRGYDYILDKITTMLKESDVVAGNLEGPITTQNSLSIHTVEGDKNHQAFTFSPETLKMLYENNIRIVSVGNNHILDFGISGLKETRSFLKKYNIEYFGDPREENQNVLMKEINGKKIGFISFNQFARQDVEQLLSEIKNTASQAGFTVVFAHWGEEYEKTPDKIQLALGRSFIDAGADLVIGTHPHVIQSKEIYNSKWIYYSLGNFVFDQYFGEDVRCGAVISFVLPVEDNRYVVEEKFVYLANDGATVKSDCASEVPTLQTLEKNNLLPR